MTWTAVEKIEESAKKTRELLLPFKSGLWTKLTFLTVLTGSGLGTAFLQIPFTPSIHMQRSMMHTPVPQLTTAILAVTGIIASLGLLFLLLNSMAEFALFKTFLTKKAKLWNYFTENTGRGLRYMAYRISILVLAVAVSASVLIIFSINPFLGLLSLLLLVPVFLAVAIFDVLVRDFVLLEMLENEQKLVESVRCIYEEFRPEWREVAAYLVVRIVITAAVGTAVATAAGFVGLILAVPGFLLLILNEMSLFYLVLSLALVLLAAIVIATIATPFKAYLYIYKIEVYQALKE